MTELAYMGLDVPMRTNVREPFQSPVLRLVRPRGTIVCVPLSEADLLSIITEAARALGSLRRSRDARAAFEREHGAGVKG